MNDSEFEVLADRTLKQLEMLLDRCEADIDVSMVGSGVLEVEFSDRSKIVVNRHVANQELWLAGRSGGFHFRWDGALWRDTRDQRELIDALSTLVSQHAGETIHLA